jgi:DNA-binding NtrC family response regulator
VALVIHFADGSEPSRTIDLADGAEVTIGRSRSATIMIPHDRISRLHTRITRRGDQVLIEDLGSRNGTWINGKQVVTATRMFAGDELIAGPVTAVLSVTSRIHRRTTIVEPEPFETRLVAEIDRALRYQRKVALVLLRLAGEERVIERLALGLRSMDLFADYGGDEYAALLPEMSREDSALMVARWLRDSEVSDARAAVVCVPEDGVSAYELLEKARAGLRRAGPGTVVADRPEMAPPVDGAVILDPVMQRLYALAERIAATPITVLIHGETGVGKELIAEAIHRHSGRNARPLVKINCAALPENLLESELFGHERGAFTGADRRKLGFFEAADGGTLFLDEIGEMTPALQAKLLRVLERKVVTRVGGTQEVPVDVRVVCATHRNLEQDVKDGRFREDLYFRIAGFSVWVPPLRDRPSEILPLAEHFMESVADKGARASLSDEAQRALLGYEWPGNVRELRNALERAVVMCAGAQITLADLPDVVQESARNLPSPVVVGDGFELRSQLAALERAGIVAALGAESGNQTRAAKRLGISRRALIYKMEKLGLKEPPGEG